MKRHEQLPREHGERIPHPIVIAEGLDLLTFPSVEDAEGQLEAIDVEEGRIETFDGLGRRLHAVVVNARTVSIRPGPSRPNDEDELRDLLLRYFELTNWEVGTEREVIATAPISEVIRALYQYQHRPRRSRLTRWLHGLSRTSQQAKGTKGVDRE